MKNELFGKVKNDVYFELLRLAKTSDVDFLDQNIIKAKESINQLHLNYDSHKRLIALIKNKANQLNVFDNLDENIKYLLNTETQHTIVKELANSHQLNQIISTLIKLQVPIILLKGAAFARSLYSKEAPRLSNDIDILVKNEHWEIVRTVLDSLMVYTEKEVPDIFGDLYEVTYIPKNKIGGVVDLHSSLIHPFLFQIEEQDMWNTSVKHKEFNNEFVRTLSPEYALIHQALHAYKDMNFIKYNLLDTYEILQQLKPNLFKTMILARECGATVPLYVLLHNCNEVMLNTTRKLVLDKITPSIFIRYLCRKLLNSNFSQPAQGKKNYRYRLNQLISQFVFTSSFIRPLKLQCFYIKSLLQHSKK